MGGHVTTMDNYCMESDGELHEPGDQWADEGVCNLKICNQEGKIVVMTCPDLPKEVSSECQLIEGNMSERYPACCDKVECDWNYSAKEKEDEHRINQWDKFVVKYEADYFLNDPELPEGFPHFDRDDYENPFGLDGPEWA